MNNFSSVSDRAIPHLDVGMHSIPALYDTSSSKKSISTLLRPSHFLVLLHISTIISHFSLFFFLSVFFSFLFAVIRNSYQSVLTRHTQPEDQKQTSTWIPGETRRRISALSLSLSLSLFRSYILIHSLPQ